MKNLGVYLAGGMRSEWREKVKEHCPAFNYYDPTDHELSEPVYYTAWDMEMIKQADIVFAYLSEDNPSGIGMAAEIGYARGLNKTIIFANESRNHYLYIVECMASICHQNLSGAIEVLKRFEVVCNA